MAEGWGWAPTSRKKHYFMECDVGRIVNRSLCGKWTIRYDNYVGIGALRQGDDDSSDNCAICKRKLKRRRTKNEK